MLLHTIALFCGSAEGHHDKYKRVAAEFGAACARRHIDLIYGGVRIGLMAAAATAAAEGGSKVTGVVPRFFLSNEVLTDNMEAALLVADSMSERKQLMEQKADAFVILPGSYGTMDEFFEVLTDAQLGRHHKPIALLNAFGYYSPLLAQMAHFRNEGFLRPFHFDLLLIAETVEDIFLKLENYQCNNSSNWLDKIKS